MWKDCLSTVNREADRATTACHMTVLCSILIGEDNTRVRYKDKMICEYNMYVMLWMTQVHQHSDVEVDILVYFCFRAVDCIIYRGDAMV